MRSAPTNHTPNHGKPQNYGLRSRKAKADRPAPTATAADIANAPFIEVVANQDMVSPYGQRAVGIFRRMTKANSPSPTVVSGGKLPGSDAPLVKRGVVANQDMVSPYADYQKAGIMRRRGKKAEPSPTVLSGGFIPGANSPLVERGVVKANNRSYAELLDRELPKKAPTPCGLRLASLFCGCGGVDLGFRSAGFELAYANDYAARAAESFAHNLGHTPIVGDVREVKGEHIGQVDVLTGGFPCVTFSMAGRRAGLVDDLNGKLYLEMCRVIGEVKPRYFVAENVRGMLSANGGNAVKLVLAAFLRLGYRTSYELVNMAEHGVPQTRQRVVFVGVRLDEWRGQFAFPTRTHRLADDKAASRRLPLARSLREAIGDLGEPGEKMLESWHADSWRNHHTRVSSVAGSRPRGPGQPGHSQVAFEPNLIVAARNVEFNNGFVPGDRPSPVVLLTGVMEVAEQPATNHETNDAPISPTHQMSKRVARSKEAAPTIVSEATNVQPLIDGVRRMTVRECARVQSFPDWFEFKGNMSDCYRQDRQRVPPLYAKRLALAVLAYDERSKL